MKHAWAGLLVASLIAASAGTSGAQGAPSAASAAVARAQAMTSDGNAAGARALLDSVLAALPSGAPETAEVLFARAGAGESAVDAEHDYRRVVVEYPTAAVAPDASLRLARIEMDRGEAPRAAARLERMRQEQPAGPARGRTSYWLARAYLESGDAPRGCAALGEARAQVPESEIEVRNQIAYYAPRCESVASVASVVKADSVAAAPAPVPAATRAPAPVPNAARRPTTATHAPAPTRAPAPAKATPSKAPAARATTYSVQVAALQQRASATAMAKKLVAAGYAARVDGAAAPYRVRVGRYPTHAAADAVARRLRARGTPALVVEAAPR